MLLNVNKRLLPSSLSNDSIHPCLMTGSIPGQPRYAAITKLESLLDCNAASDGNDGAAWNNSEVCNSQFLKAKCQSCHPATSEGRFPSVMKLAVGKAALSPTWASIPPNTLEQVPPSRPPSPPLPTPPLRSRPPYCS